jgi:REP element-mobilizing transposase RayT
MRKARQKSLEDAYYHLTTRVAGLPDFYPFMDKPARRKLRWMIRHYTRIYAATLLAFQIMGSHYHAILWMRCFTVLARRELERRARLLWGDRMAERTARWTDEDWDRFNHKLFDLSALMQHINGEFAKWYNRRSGRRGHFWADRYKNPQLMDEAALRRCVVYVETNGTRAGMVDRPEQWAESSAWLRYHGLDGELMPLEQIFPAGSPEEAYRMYRELLELRCLADREHHSGRERFQTDATIVSSRAERVERFLAEARDRGYYRRRRNPVPQLDGLLYTDREQRSNARF